MKKIVFLTVLCLFGLLFGASAAQDNVPEQGMMTILEGDDAIYGIGYDIPEGSYYFSCGDPEIEDCEILVNSWDYYQLSEDMGLDIRIYGGEYGHPVRVFLKEGAFLKVLYSPVMVTVADPIIFR